MIQVRKPPITFSFKVIGLLQSENRVEAARPELLGERDNPGSVWDSGDEPYLRFREPCEGLGRPTKKDRRELEQFTEPEFMDDGFDFEFDFGEEDEE